MRVHKTKFMWAVWKFLDRTDLYCMKLGQKYTFTLRSHALESINWVGVCALLIWGCFDDILNDLFKLWNIQITYICTNVSIKQHYHTLWKLRIIFIPNICLACSRQGCKRIRQDLFHHQSPNPLYRTTGTSKVVLIFLSSRHKF